MASMPEIQKLAQAHGIQVVEDCAQAPGAAINGIKSGNFGEFGIDIKLKSSIVISISPLSRYIKFKEFDFNVLGITIGC